MFDDWRKFDKKFRQTIHDLFPYGSCTIFLLIGGEPARDNVVRVNLSYKIENLVRSKQNPDKYHFLIQLYQLCIHKCEESSNSAQSIFLNQFGKRGQTIHPNMRSFFSFDDHKRSALNSFASKREDTS